MSWIQSINRHVGLTSRWVRAFLRWLFVDPKEVWIFALIAMPPLWYALTRPCEPKFRLSGLTLQLLGFVIVAWSFHHNWKLFRPPGIRLRVLRWWKSRPSYERLILPLQAVGAASGAFGGRARLTIRPGPNTPLPKRVDILEHTVSSLDQEVGQLESSFRDHVANIDAALKQEKSERIAQDQRIEKKMVQAVGDGLHLEGIGLCLFVIGIIAGTASPEIAGLLGGSIVCSQ